MAVPGASGALGDTSVVGSMLGRVRRRNTVTYLLLALIVIIAAALRFIRLDELTLFLGDEGRDANIVWQAVLSGQIPPLGPASSIGTWSRGPAFYILLMPAYFLARGDPLAGAVTIALFDIGTVVMLFVLGSRVGGPAVGLVAAAIWAVAPEAVWFGRFMWNPQLVPFFVILAFYALARMSSDGRWLIVVAVAWSLAWQCHDQALLVVPSLAVGLVLLRARLRAWHLAAAIGAFLVSLAPYLLYESSHAWSDIGGMVTYIIHGSGDPLNSNDLSGPGRLSAVLGAVAQFLPGPLVEPLVVGGLLAVGTVVLLRTIRTTRGSASIAVGLWLAVPLLYWFWRGQFDAAYLMVVYPLAVLLIGLAVVAIARSHVVMGILTTFAVCALVATAASSQWQSLTSASVDRWMLGSVRAVVATIQREAGGEPFAFELVSSHSQGPNLVTPLYWHDYLAEPFLYLFGLAAGSPSARADLPTFVAFDTPGMGSGYGSEASVGGFGVIRFDAPILGPNLLVDPSTGSTQWTSDSGGFSTGTDAGGPFVRIDGLPVAQARPDGRNVTTIAHIDPNARYLVSFQTRNAPGDGTQRAYAQVRDVAGTALVTRPTAGSIAPSSTWTTSAFVVDAPADGMWIVIYLRNAGSSTVYFRNVEVRRVLSVPIPGAPGD